MVHVVWPTRTSTMSPGRTSFAGLMRTPFRSTRPPVTASVGAPRVLKNRAAQSHLSIRTSSMSREANQAADSCSVGGILMRLVGIVAGLLLLAGGANAGVIVGVNDDAGRSLGQ